MAQIAIIRHCIHTASKASTVSIVIHLTADNLPNAAELIKEISEGISVCRFDQISQPSSALSGTQVSGSRQLFRRKLAQCSAAVYNNDVEHDGYNK